MSAVITWRAVTVAAERQKFPLRLALQYTDGALGGLHDLEVDPGVRVKVIGDPADGAYEWCIEREDGLTFSTAFRSAHCATAWPSGGAVPSMWRS